ncbi:MAG: flagellar basal body P-ring protein FlgI [bacterium]
MKKIITLIILFVLLSSSVFSQRIKDIAYIKGVGNEQLIGYGLIVGLAGTGDSYRSSFTIQSIKSMLKRFGITVPEENLRTRNVAAVMVTATINNLMKQGAEFDVIVSSMGDATSLMGGTLLMTPLSGKDGAVYAMAQGPLSIGGYDINTKSGGRIAKNHATSGRIPSGGLLESPMPAISFANGPISVVLKEPDFTTANNIVNAINAKFGGAATAVDGSEITVTPPANDNGITGFLAELESIQVQKDVEARVVVNERTGTIVAGQNVKISPVTISHGSLNITIKSYPIISQPNGFSQGQTTTFNNLVPTVEQEGSNAVSIQGASNVQEVAAALNSLKVSPRDVIAIFQALKEAGALSAELVII